jgi:hypothetical protein
MITKTNIKNGVLSNAVYSRCEKYRYSLTRIWNEGLQKITFIMLNPSTATEIQNDPTVERCEQRARSLGYGSFRVCNIFAWRDTDPKKMKLAYNPIGEFNDQVILESCLWADLILCAWGTHGNHLDRDQDLLSKIYITKKDLYHLGLSKNGFPKHPLYISYAQKPLRWAT